jgi:hypothetical protein
MDAPGTRPEGIEGATLLDMTPTGLSLTYRRFLSSWFGVSGQARVPVPARAAIGGPDKPGHDDEEQDDEEHATKSTTKSVTTKSVTTKG